MSNRPITTTEAAELSRSIEQACRTRDPSVLIRLMTKDTVWRDNDAVHVGRDEIWTALGEKWVHALHCSLRQDVESRDLQCILIRFESEWQHSIRGRWYRTSGTTRLSLDDEGRIKTVETRHTDTPISVSTRRLTISTAATTKPAN